MDVVNPVKDYLSFFDFLNSFLVLCIELEHVRDEEGQELFEEEFVLKSVKKGIKRFSNLSEIEIFLSQLFNEIRISYRLYYFETQGDKRFTLYKKDIENQISIAKSNYEIVEGIHKININIQVFHIIGFDVFGNPKYSNLNINELSGDEFKSLNEKLVHLKTFEFSLIESLEQGIKTWNQTIGKEISKSDNIVGDFPYWMGEPEKLSGVAELLVEKGFIQAIQKDDFICLFTKSEKRTQEPQRLPIIWKKTEITFAHFCITFQKHLNISEDKTAWRYYQNPIFFKKQVKSSIEQIHNLQSSYSKWKATKKLVYRDDPLLQPILSFLNTISENGE